MRTLFKIICNNKYNLELFFLYRRIQNRITGRFENHIYFWQPGLTYWSEAPPFLKVRQLKHGKRFYFIFPFQISFFRNKISIFLKNSLWNYELSTYLKTNIKDAASLGISVDLFIPFGSKFYEHKVLKRDSCAQHLSFRKLFWFINLSKKINCIYSWTMELLQSVQSSRR